MYVCMYISVTRTTLLCSFDVETSCAVWKNLIVRHECEKKFSKITFIRTRRVQNSSDMVKI